MFSSDNYNFYSLEKSQYIAWACFRNVINDKTTMVILNLNQLNIIIVIIIMISIILIIVSVTLIIVIYYIVLFS